VANHRQVYGEWCPGYRVPAHTTEPANPLTGDHIQPLARGGTSTADNVQVLCRQCNARKRDQA
jgi:5-methylcytosine-specific restriction protein A